MIILKFYPDTILETSRLNLPSLFLKKMGVGPSAILGSTNKFFMPWLVPRNQKDTVHAPTIFGKLGRKRREIETEELAQEVITCE